MINRAFPVLALAILSMGCADDDPTAPAPSLRPDGAVPPLVVLTRNMYVGADLDAVVAAIATGDPAALQAALLTGVQQISANDLSTRIAALVREIAQTRPHAIALQEVTELTLTIPTLGVHIEQHFLDLLLHTLALRGLSYRVVSVNHNFELDLMAMIGVPGRLRDADVLLVDSRVRVQSTHPATFSLGLPIPNFGTLTAGYALVRAKVAGLSVAIAGAHPSSSNTPGGELLRAAQMTELVAAIGNAERAVIMGDLNSEPGSPLTQVLAGAGFRDAWAELGTGPGFTCCLGPWLDGSASFNQRIDQIWFRGPMAFDRPTARAGVIGASEGERVVTPSGARIYPSDHAGVLVVLPLR